MALLFVAVAACGSATNANPATTAPLAPTVATVGLTPLPIVVPASTSAPRTSTTATPASSTTALAPVSTTTTAVGTSTTVTGQPAGSPRQPLTGLPVTDPGQTARPALVVKIDNHPGAKPQVGLERADVVIEEVVEGITRFFAVYQSDIPDVVGPVRSARTQDALLVPMLGRPLFAWSGGNAGVRKVIHDAPLVDLGAQESVAAAAWYRDTRRVIPHNLFTKASKLYWLAPPGLAPPPVLFRYRDPDAPAVGVDVRGMKLTMAGTRVEWSWDAASQSWRRLQNGSPHITAAKVPITAANVVVLEVDYKPSPADAHSPEAQTVGSGKVTVLTGGRAIEGTWTRKGTTSTWDLRDAAGRPILLTPGKTWVELTPVGHAAVVGS